jgi:hypothetical protein
MSQLSFIKSIYTYKLVSLTNKWYLAKLFVKKVFCFTNALLQLLIVLECNLEILTQRVQTLGQKNAACSGISHCDFKYMKSTENGAKLKSRKTPGNRQTDKQTY